MILAGESEAKVGESDLAMSLKLLAKVKSESGESTLAKSLKSLMAKAKKSSSINRAALFKRAARKTELRDER